MANTKRSKRREELILTVKRGLDMTGAALQELRDDEHWKETHNSFVDFCRDTFSISKTKLYTILKGMEVISSLPKNLQPLITNDSQVLELSKLPTDERAAVIKKCEKNGGVTAESIAIHSETASKERPRGNVTDKVTKVPNSGLHFSQPAESETGSKRQNPVSKKDRVYVFDRVGTIVPNDALPYWKRRQEVQNVLTQISKLRTTIKDARDGGDCLWVKHGQDGYEYLSRAYSYLSDALPHAVCLQCQGSFTLQPEGCSVCGNTGFISEYKFDHYLPKELREIRMRSNADLAKQHPESPLNKKQE